MGALVLFGLVIACGCNPKLDYAHDSKEVESMLRESFVGDTGVEVERIDCPAKMLTGKVVCKLKTKSKQEIDLHVLLDGASSEWEAPGIVFAKKLDAVILAEFSRKGIKDFKPSCPELARAVVGDSFVCPAKWKGGDVEVTVGVAAGGTYSFKTPWIDVGVTSKALTEKVRAQSPKAPDLDCDDGYVPQRPGLRLECRAGSETVVLVVQDDGESFNIMAGKTNTVAPSP